MYRGWVGPTLCAIEANYARSFRDAWLEDRLIFLCYRSITYVRAGFGVVDTCFVVRVRPFGL